MLTNLYLYSKERFPIIPVLLFSFGYAAYALGVSSNNNWSFSPQLAIRLLFVFTCIFTFFLLRQRVTDEFKDSFHDLKNFPDRPVPRGLISKEQLILLGIMAILLEWFCVYLLGKNSLIVYLPVFLYSLLMAKEFFMPEWLNRHFNLYLLSHEVIFILFGIFFIMVTNEDLKMTNLFFSLGVLLTAPFSVEIIRKFSPRYDKKGKAVHDTYTTMWGRVGAIIILLLLMLLTGLFLTIIKNSYLPLSFSTFLSLVALFFGKKSDRIIVTAGAINFLGLALLANILW